MRSLSPAVLAAIAAKTLTLAVFAQVSFADNSYYLFTGQGQITPAGPPVNPASTFPYGQTFTGMGWLAKISTVPQTTKTQAQNLSLSLSGIPSTLVTEVINEVRITGTVTLWIGFFDGNNNLLTDPVQIFSGSSDVPSITDDGATSTITITYENSLLSLNLAPNRQFDDADQQIYYPGDLGFSFVDQLPNCALFWPAPVATASPYPLYMTVTLSSPNIAVGGTCTVTGVTVHYSDGSTFTRTSSGGTSGSGPGFICTLASSNPKIATFAYAGGIVTGISPGECSIIARIPWNIGINGASQQFRAAVSLFVT